MNPGAASALRSYEQWRDLFAREFGLTVIDDEGYRRCARARRLEALLGRAEAETFFLLNSVIRGHVSAGS